MLRGSVAAVTVATLALTWAATSGAEPARAAESCGATGMAAASAGGGLLYEVDGSVRARGVRCPHARKIVRRYIGRTRGEGGRVRVLAFRCRGGPRRHDRFIADCRRGGGKRVFFEGTGGPARGAF